MDRPIRDKKPSNPLNYATMGGKNPKTPPFATPKKRVFERWEYEEIDDFGGSASFPDDDVSTQPPPVGPYLPDYYTEVKVKKVKVSATGKGKHTVFADE
jgi:hypothetical protein